ncbi:MAG: hypothetical protein WC216_02785 [Gallionella sp.]|jgi:hypothetical protein
MDALTKLKARLDSILTDISTAEKQIVNLQAERKEIEAALRVIGRYSPDAGVVEPVRATESSPSNHITLTDAILLIIKSAGPKGISSSEMRSMLDIIYGYPNVKTPTLSVTLTRHKEKGRIKKVGKTWFLSSLAPGGAGNEENSGVGAPESGNIFG